MTVKELIEKLQEFPEDSQVDVYDGGAYCKIVNIWYNDGDVDIDVELA